MCILCLSCFIRLFVLFDAVKRGETLTGELCSRLVGLQVGIL